jgi:hypothetical protein
VCGPRGGVPLCLWPRWSGGTLPVMSDEACVEEQVGEGMRPCVFCNHPVVIESLDEWDCPVCGAPDDDQPEVAGRDS